jgi:2-dehydropantoate 2-reductase
MPRVAIIGAGAIGCYIGTRLAAAGTDVRFLMRSGLAEVRARGSMRIFGVTPPIEASPVAVYGSAGEIGPVDVALVCLKTTAAQADALISPVVGPATHIATLQNGLGADEALGERFGRDRVVGGLAFMAITRRGPGEVDCYHPGSVTLGELEGPATARTRELAGLLESGGVKARVVDDLMAARWGKLVWNIPFNGLAIAEGGLTTDRICADPRLAGEVRALMAEVQRAAAGFGYALSDDFVRRQFDVTPGMGPYQPSSLVDFKAGRDVEVEAIWGEPLRRATARGIPMPRLERLYARLRACCPAGA